MSRLPPLNMLKAFDAAARHLSLSRAANELGVTHGAVSRQIKALEDYVGQILFRRNSDGIALTEVGSHLSAGVHDAFNGMRATFESVKRRPNRDVVTVSTVASFAAHWLVPRLSAFQADHSNIDIRISTSSRLIDFDVDGIDVAIRFGRGHWPNTRSTLLLPADAVPVCSPEFAKRFLLDVPANLAAAPLLHDVSPEFWQAWFAATGVTRQSFDPGVIYDDFNVIVQAAIDGQGIALVPKILVMGDINHGRLVQPIDYEVRLPLAYYIATSNRQPLTASAESFRSWLASEAESKNVSPKIKHLRELHAGGLAPVIADQ